jgi:hypothetical protein
MCLWVYRGKIHTHTHTHTHIYIYIYLGDGDLFGGEFCEELLAFAGGTIPDDDGVPVVDEAADHACVCVCVYVCVGVCEREGKKK